MIVFLMFTCAFSSFAVDSGGLQLPTSLASVAVLPGPKSPPIAGETAVAQADPCSSWKGCNALRFVLNAAGKSSPADQDSLPDDDDDGFSPADFKIIAGGSSSPPPPVDISASQSSGAMFASSYC